MAGALCERRPEDGTRMDTSKFLGGRPIAVILRLVILSLLVGILLSMFGVTPRNFLSVIDGFFRYLYDLGFGAFEWLFEFLLLGAMLVIPIWLVVRLFKAGGSRPGAPD
jgi:hypothetical protein